MDSVGTCLVCGARLCPEHALRGRGSERYVLDTRVRALGVSLKDLSGTFPVDLNGVRADLRPLFRFEAQRQAFFTALYRPEVICEDCRVNGAFEAAGATRPTAPALGAGGSQRLRDAVAAYLLGDMVAWDSMASDAAVKDALFQDLIHLAREKAKRVQVPVEWEVIRHGPSSGWSQGKVRATEEVFRVVDVGFMVRVRDYDGGYNDAYRSSTWYMDRYGRWGIFSPDFEGKPHLRYTKPVIVKKAGWFSKEELAFRVSWSDKPPQPELHDVLKRAAALLRPAA